MFYLLDEKRTVTAELIVQASSSEEALRKYLSGEFVEISESFLTNEQAVVSCVVCDEKQKDPIIKRAISVLTNIESNDFKEKNNKRKKGKVENNV